MMTPSIPAKLRNSVSAVQRRLPVVLAWLLVVLISGAAQTVPQTDIRSTEVRHLDLRYTFTPYTSRDEWLRRAESLRRQILVSAGLWPLTARPPVRAEVFGKTNLGDVTIEKVSIETRSGFYLNGNLYRPANTSQTRMPAILSPHGHWIYGRLENTPTASVPGRAIGLARLGMIVFTYDMVGYADTTAVSHRFATGHREGFDVNTLWSVNLLGLQLWNSIRALDFLLTLPDVDPERIGATGASGGGTQTFLLAAVDDRVKAAAPVNMISAQMQGGSLCENAPNLRIDTNNMELGALVAPRPMIMVAATGDWTVNSPTVEYPAVRSIYQLLGAESKLHFVQFNAPHNYNQASREAVYGFFAHYFLGRSDATPIKERSFSAPPLSDQLVFFGRARPANEVNENTLATNLIAEAKQRVHDAIPGDERALQRYRDTFGTALNYSLMVEYPDSRQIASATVQAVSGSEIDGAVTEKVALSRSNKRDRVELTIWQPKKLSASGAKPPAITLIATPSNSSAGSTARVIGSSTVSAGEVAAHLACFADLPKPPASTRFVTTYNRSAVSNRVQDILTAIAYLRGRFPDVPIKVAGLEDAGLWTLLARAFSPKVSRMVVDVCGFNNTSDEAFVEKLPVPGLRYAGDFTTAVVLADASPMLIHHTASAFKTDELKAIYRRLGSESSLEVSNATKNASEIAAWLLRR